MKLILFKRLPKDVILAFSGGLDSSVLLSVMLKMKLNVTLLFIHHATAFCDVEEEFAKNIAQRYSLELIIHRIRQFDGTGSKEAYWSVERRKIYFKMDKLVVTANHLDDAVESYVMSTFQGTVKLLDYQNQNIARPLICTTRKKIQEYANYHQIEYLTDPSNSDPGFGLRNKVRLMLMPDVNSCFPGLRKTVARLIREKEIKKEKTA